MPAMTNTSLLSRMLCPAGFDPGRGTRPGVTAVVG
jgi:hypothetical protein